MTARDTGVLTVAAFLFLVGCFLAWLPLGFIAAGVIVAAAWYWIVDDVGGEQ